MSRVLKESAVKFVKLSPWVRKKTAFFGKALPPVGKATAKNRRSERAAPAKRPVYEKHFDLFVSLSLQFHGVSPCRCPLDSPPCVRAGSLILPFFRLSESGRSADRLLRRAHTPHGAGYRCRLFAGGGIAGVGGGRRGGMGFLKAGEAFQLKLIPTQKKTKEPRQNAVALSVILQKVNYFFLIVSEITRNPPEPSYW